MSDLFQNIPAELRGLNRWVLWRFVQVAERKTKVPFQRNGAKASSTDPLTWCSFEQATQAQGFDGIGFVFSQDDDICGVDLDHHRGADGALDSFAVGILQRLDSYAEFSPSGEGIHIILRGNIPRGRKDSARGLEVYPTGRYFTFTGRHVPGTPGTVEKRHDAVAALYTEFFQEKQAELPQVKPSRALSLDDATLLSKARSAKDGGKFSRLWAGDSSDYGGDESRADAGLLAVLRFWTQGDKARAFALFGQSGLADAKWQRPDYQERTWASIDSGEVYDPAHRSPAPTAAPGGTDLPIIELPGGGEITYTACARKLFGLIAPKHVLFNRGGETVRLAADDRGQVQLAEFTADEAKSCFEKHGRLMGWRKGEGGDMVLKSVLLSHEIATGLLESQERRELLPTIRGLIGCPMIREVGGALQTAGPGFDATTGYFVTGGKTPHDVPIGEAATALWGLLADYDFATPSDKSRALAMMLTPALKVGNFFAGYAPAEIAEADASQSGKTFRLRVTAALYNEWPAMITQKNGGVGGTDESFSEALVRGRPFVLLDNWRGALSSAHIESFLTARGPFACRIPHRGTVYVDPERFFISMSSNGAESTLDFANRSCIVRIKKQRQDYAFKKFPEGDLLAHVEKNQAYYLGCVFSVIREWHRLGKPVSTECRHSFREWVRPLDWIVQNILKGAPIMNGHLDVQTRVSNPDQTWLRSLMMELAECNRLGDALSATDILEFCQGSGLAVPGLAQDATEQGGKIRLGNIFAKLFKSANPLIVDGLEITRDERQPPRAEGGSKTVKFYTVRRHYVAEPPVSPQNPETVQLWDNNDIPHHAAPTAP